jgi:hypothetical protein
MDDVAFASAGEPLWTFLVTALVDFGRIVVQGIVFGLPLAVLALIVFGYIVRIK